MKNIIRKNFIPGLLIVISLLLIVNVFFNLSNRKVLLKTYEIQRETEAVKDEFKTIFESTLRSIDLGLRGYALTKNKGLLSPYSDAIKANIINLRHIDSLLTVQKLDTVKRQFAEFKIKLNEYLGHTAKMKEAIERDSINEFLKLLNLDKGFDLWVAFSPLDKKVIKYEDSLVQKAKDDYARTLNNNVIFQFLLILISFPTLGFIIYRLNKDDKERRMLLKDFQESNELYVFNPGEENGSKGAQHIIENSVTNLKKASEFIREITQGNYQADWQGLTTGNDALNKDNLVGNLVRMRDEMKRVKEEDQKRLWITEGLAKFSEVVRNNQHSITALSEGVVRYLTKYMNAEQGSLFILKSEESHDPYLVLAGCYAFDRKKYTEKKIAIGEGLVGQVYLERVTKILTQLPQGYTKITSGLGHSTPSCIVITPMIYNDKVECITELAGFKRFKDHEIQFLEKAGEFVASALHAVRTAEQTSQLLKQSQEYAERLRSQEEEIRQNMEEMQATQEQSTRQLRELKS